MIDDDREKVRLPKKPFLYTIDQIALILSTTESNLRRKYLYFVGRSIGTPKRSMMKARNLANPDQQPDWRVSEDELIRWLRTRGFKYYEGIGFQ